MVYVLWLIKAHAISPLIECRMKSDPEEFRHPCPICREMIASCFEEQPTVCPSCRNVLVACGICGARILRTPIVHCRKCKRTICLECRNDAEPAWQALKWWSLCHGCNGNGSR